MYFSLFVRKSAADETLAVVFIPKIPFTSPTITSKWQQNLDNMASFGHENEVSLSFDLDDKFEIQSTIGSGSFGEIFLARNTKNDEVVAAKVEMVKNKTKSQLRREAKIYRLLKGSGMSMLVVCSFNKLIYSPIWNNLPYSGHTSY